MASHPCIADWACWQALEACSRLERTEPLSREAARAHVAWKTGTSSGYRDAWCAAVTPAYTVVVWLGNVDGREADALVGVDAGGLALHDPFVELGLGAGELFLEFGVAPAAAEEGEEEALAHFYLGHIGQPLTLSSRGEGARSRCRD